LIFPNRAETTVEFSEEENPKILDKIYDLGEKDSLASLVTEFYKSETE